LKILFSPKSHQKIILPVPTVPRTYSAPVAASGFPDLNRSESDLELPLKKKEPAQTAAALNEKSLEDIMPAENNGYKTIDREPSTVEPSAGEQRVQKTEKQAAVSASADKMAPTARAATTFESNQAAILGQLTLQRNETLSRIIQRVYGAYSSRYFKSFIKANPGIEDPDRVEAGQIIALPAIPVRVKPPEIPVWWVKVDEKDSLEAAFNILRTLPDSSPAMRLIPHWNPLDGTKFALILNEAFKDEHTARHKLQNIPAGISSNPKVMSWWDKETVYFANPYLNLNN
ncbi:MAG: hypothetical protein P8X90_31280, partial [Desulfobacterales bacterium]